MLFNRIIEYLFPNTCFICGKIIKYSSCYCEKCSSILQYNKARIIRGASSYNFDYSIGIFEYSGMIKSKICKMKFREGKYLIKPFAYIMYNEIIRLNLKFDYIIPVPISFRRFLERGYNQSAKIAIEINKLLDGKYYKDILIKTKNNKKQSDLTKIERQNNVLNVYNIKNKKMIANKSILLVDDIFTTGATANECSKILKKNGAKNVIVITLAYTNKKL